MRCCSCYAPLDSAYRVVVFVGQGGNLCAERGDFLFKGVEVAMQGQHNNTRSCAGPTFGKYWSC